MSPVRDASHGLTEAVAATIEALGLAEQDWATARLARRYAEVIDDCKDQAWAMRWIGPNLLAALVQLGASPTARAQFRPPEDKGKPGRPVSRLDQLRAARPS